MQSNGRSERPPYDRDPRRMQYNADPRRQGDPRYARDPRAQYGRSQNDPRYARDPRAQYGRAQNDVRYGRDGRVQYGRGQNDPRYARAPYAQYGRQYDPRYGRTYDEREAYLRAKRAEEIRREKARRAEYERRRAIEREKLRQIELRLKKERKERRRRLMKIFYGRAVVTFVIFLILAAMTAGALAISFNLTPDGPPSKLTYTFGGKTYRSVSSDTAIRDGKLYVCFNDVADYTGLHVTGDVNGMKFVFPSDDTDAGSEGTGREDHVVFFTDSRSVVINSRKITLDAESFLYGEEIWVSTEFIEEYVEGLDVTRKGTTVAVAKLEDEALSTEDETVYLDVSLRLKDDSPLPPSADAENGDSSVIPDEPIVFKSDLSAYEQYMDPEDTEEFLILVNSATLLDASFAPTDLVEVAGTRQDGRETQLLRATAAYALEALFTEMQAEGFTDVSVMSGYRSYESQAYLHNQYIAGEMAADPSLSWADAEAIVLTYSARPGESEHQTGLCVDMHNLWQADVSYAAEPSYMWLCDNAWKFGFILRYPEDKTAVTGISFEPWHWRFVGRENARIIHYSGISLEEYVNN